MSDSPTILLAAGGPKTRLRGRVLAPARYRHPGDVIRLIAAALVLAAAVVIAALLPALLRPAAAVTGVGPATEAGQVLTGLVQVMIAAAALVLLAAALRYRRFRVLATVAGGFDRRGPAGHRRAAAAAAGAGAGGRGDRGGGPAGGIRGAGPADGPRRGGSGPSRGRRACQPGDRTARRRQGIAAVPGDHRRRACPVREGLRLRSAGRRPAVPGLARHPAARRRRHQARGLAVQGRRA